MTGGLLLLRRGIVLVLMLATIGCVPAPAPAPPPSPPLPQLPTLELGPLTTQPLQLRVLDRRATPIDSAQWVQRVSEDVSTVLTRSGVPLAPAGAAWVLEIRLIQLSAEAHLRQWKGCAHLTAVLVLANRTIHGQGRHCTTQANLWGAATADVVLALAYQEAVAELLARLEAQLR